MAGLGGAGSAETKTLKPNLLIIHTDPLSRRALSVYAPRLTRTPNYGKTLVETPNIDRFVANVDVMPTLLGLMQLPGSGREQGRDASA